jgi:hypothetical protein
MRDNFLPFLRKCVNALDDGRAPLGDNFLMSEFLRYRVRDSREISPTLSIQGMRRGRDLGFPAPWYVSQ